jgi:hypothetical protein
VATGSIAVGPLLQATRTVPIVFTIVPDPVGAGFVDSLARPGGNATGFTNYEYGMSGKWLELLKEIAPRVTRAAVLRDPAVASGIGQPCRRTRRFPAPLIIRQSVRRWPCPSWVGCATIISERRFPTGTGRSDTLLLWELQLASWRRGAIMRP